MDSHPKHVLIALQSHQIAYFESHYRPVMWVLIVTAQLFILAITARFIIQSGNPSKPFNFSASFKQRFYQMLQISEAVQFDVVL